LLPVGVTILLLPKGKKSTLGESEHLIGKYLDVKILIDISIASDSVIHSLTEKNQEVLEK
jgi:hypothetical protein